MWHILEDASKKGSLRNDSKYAFNLSQKPAICSGLSWTFGMENYLSIQNVSNRLGCQDVINHNKKLWSSAESSDKYTLFNTPLPQTWTFCTVLAINLSGGCPVISIVWCPALDGSTHKWWWINTNNIHKYTCLLPSFLTFVKNEARTHE